MLPNPSDVTYADYRDSVTIDAESALERLAEDRDPDVVPEWPDDYDGLHEAVHDAVDSDPFVVNYGYMLVTVLLSDQSPDRPDYCESWDVYCDLSNDPSWADAVGAMAYVCYYSDVFDAAKRMIEKQEEEREA